ncbi:MAG: hypothetical protein K1W36_22310 [Lachnospiraceae bacterium]|jgi:hypothetical protein|nr:hypothetical protein C809_03836 [Lachnospiraceae bacterium MD335]GFI46123.1 hypothetical protein IMSAGC019_01436 [Lachnospiraceae bacterium]
MTLSDGIRNFSAYFRMFVERFINFFLFSIVTFQKSVITTVKGYKVISPGKEGTEPMEKSQELIGILQAISIVAKSLAAKLMQIEKEVEAYEAAKAAVQERKAKKGWRR